MTDETKSTVHTDEDGIPMLFDVVRPGSRVNQMEPEDIAVVHQSSKNTTPQKPNSDANVNLNADLSNIPEMQELISEIASDLDKEVAWKLEKVLTAAISDTVHQCIDAMSASVNKSVTTHLSLMMPVLLEMLHEHAQEEAKKQYKN